MLLNEGMRMEHGEWRLAFETSFEFALVVLLIVLAVPTFAAVSLTSTTSYEFSCKLAGIPSA
jgi:hypothetical protein